jgi:hypothetical protein
MLFQLCWSKVSVLFKRAWRTTHGKLHSELCGGDDCEDMVLCSRVNDTSSVEVFESIEDQMILVIRDIQIVISGIDSA